MQARSAVRLTNLLDAAASVVHDIGFERLTTAMVAERAGSSIGTVYRYFPDRLVVLRALSMRSLDRWDAEGVPALSASSAGTWLEVVTAALDYWADAFARESGFRSLRFGDVVDIRPRESHNNAIVVDSIVAAIVSRELLETDEALALNIEVALSLSDALLVRAYAFEEAGDARFIQAARSTAQAYLVDIYGQPSGS
ncbi:MAG: hypothetical protein RI885_1744 [Actinomycetota bacterium]